MNKTAEEELKEEWYPLSPPWMRRKAALRVADGDYKVASDLLLALARARRNPKVKYLAHLDASYFYKRYRKLINNGIAA